MRAMKMTPDDDSEEAREDREIVSDPQYKTFGTLKVGPKSDVIKFRLHFYYLEMLFIVTVPNEGTTSAPVYIKFKLKQQLTM